MERLIVWSITKDGVVDTARILPREIVPSDVRPDKSVIDRVLASPILANIVLIETSVVASILRSAVFTSKVANTEELMLSTLEREMVWSTTDAALSEIPRIFCRPRFPLKVKAARLVSAFTMDSIIDPSIVIMGISDIPLTSCSESEFSAETIDDSNTDFMMPKFSRFSAVV